MNISNACFSETFSAPPRTSSPPPGFCRVTRVSSPIHGFTDGSDGAYQPVATGEFIAGVNHAKSFGDVWIDSVVNVGAYWRAQKMLVAIQPTTAGNSKTWKWTLPPHFPPGKVLRVKVDGGTLTQPDGRTLAWDDHGYYEVALDAGSLTLSP